MPENWKPSVFQLVVFAIGGVLVYMGEDWGVPGATDIGIAFLGVLFVTAGADLQLKRVRIFKTDGWANVVETYRGVLELLWGLIFIAIGLLMIAAVAVTRFAPGGVRDFWSDALLSNTGIGVVLSVAGLMAMLNGVIRALAGSGRVNPRRVGGLAGVVDRSAGAMSLAFGAVVAAIGLVLLVAPEWLAAGVQSVMGLLH
jgi:hypothetical protein